ncbi:MAG: hypothetical protein ACKVOS_04060 [Sphingorhabdus sp.]|uniref:hypothetical protein n=1 Tax=Sphingorhabdus sp. TaxID=1902408 RepID=UPI0038FC29A3
MPCQDAMTANEMKRLTVESLTPDRVVTKNYRSVERIFHRRSTDALKPPAGQAAR